MDSRDAVLELILELLGEEEFRAARRRAWCSRPTCATRPQPSTRSSTGSARVERAHPLTVRLVKGAYWDHEIVQARQHGWESPVFDVKADCDLNFEALTRRLLDARPAVRVAIASHNLRSVSHAIAYNRLSGGDDVDLEMQVLRGLGDPLQTAIARQGLRVRTYCPVGDLVAGMAYLVRRLLENTSNESFLAEQAHGAALDELLAPSRRPPRSPTSRSSTPAIVPPREALRQRADPRAAPRLGAAASPTRSRATTPRARCGSGVDRRRPARGRDIVSTDPGNPDRVVAEAARRDRRRDVDHALARRGPGTRRRRSAPTRSSARPSGCASGGSRSPRWPCASARSRGRRPTPTSARRSTSSSTTRAARSTSRRAPLLQPPGERNELRWDAARDRRRHLALELPRGDRARDDRRRARHRQRGDPQARRAVARLRARAHAGAARGRRAAERARAAARRGRRRRRAGARPARAHDRVHRLQQGRPRDRARRRRDAARAEAPQARDRRDGRQELRDRRLRRRPRRGRPRARQVGVRLRRPEVLGRRPRAVPRGDPRRAGRAPGGRRSRCSRSARPTTSRSTSRR